MKLGSVSGGGLFMDLLRDDTKKLFLRYLFPSFGSAIIACVYSLVDMAAVGQYKGSEGTAALAVIAPIWNVIYSIGLLGGIGGSVIFSALKGKDDDVRNRNSYFTVSLVLVAILSVLSTITLAIFMDDILRFFGATDSLLPLCHEYLNPIMFVLPSFAINQLLAAFLRNDGDPALAMIAVIGGGIFNVIGDFSFVFLFGLGLFGAGLATAIGSVITIIVMCIHFFKKKNTLRFAKPDRFFVKSWEISRSGFSSFFVDFAMGIITIFFNRQIMAYVSSGEDALAIYGVILNVNTFVQCCAYGVGQAAQPIISVNYGAKKYDRIKEILKYSLISIGIISLLWGVFSMAFPNVYVLLFISGGERLFEMSGKIIRLYAISFFLLPFNIFSTYYFQSLLKPGTAFIVSILRGFLLSGALIFMFPPLFGGDSLWLSMPISETIVAIYVVVMIVIYTKKLGEKDPKEAE